MLYVRKDARKHVINNKGWGMKYKAEQRCRGGCQRSSLLKHLLASALCVSASPLPFPLFVTYTLIYSSQQLCVSVAELFLSYSQSGVRLSHILTAVALCCPLLPPLPEPRLFHLSLLFFPPFFFLTVQSKSSQMFGLGDGYLLCT